MSNKEPTHVLGRNGDRRSLCGKRDPLPAVLAHYVAAHQHGHGMVVCDACQAAWGDRPWPFADDPDQAWKIWPHEISST